MRHPWRLEALLGLEFEGSRTVRIEATDDFNVLVDAAVRAPPAAAARIIVFVRFDDAMQELRIDDLRQWSQRADRPTDHRRLTSIAGFSLEA